jgi:hypothetical protein
MRKCVRGVTSDFEVFEELVDHHSIQGQATGSYSVQAFLCSVQKHHLEPSKLVGTVTDDAPFMTGSKMTSHLYKHIHELGLELINTVSLHYPSTKPNWQSSGI